MTQVQRSLATLGVAALLAAGVGGYAFWSGKQDEQKQKADEQAAQLFPFDPAQVNSLTLSAKGETTTLTKSAEGWKLTAPVQARADEAAVQAILEQLKELKSKSTVEEHGASQLAKYGLDKPSARVTVAWSGGGGELTLGAVNGYSGGQYAQRSGSDAILLLNGSHDAAFARTTFELRDKRLARIDESQVQRIDVSAPPDRYAIERSGDGWQVVEPKSEKADDAQVRRVLSALEDLRATSIADETGSELAKWGLDKPADTLALTMKDGSKVQLSLAVVQQGSEKRGYARTTQEPVIAQVPVDAAQPLHQSLESLEDKTVARVDRSAVVAMQFTTAGGQQVLLQKKKGEPDAGTVESWVELGPKSGDAKRWKVNSLLYLFSNLKAQKIAAPDQKELAKFGLEKPSRVAVLQDVSGKALAEVKLGKEENGSVYAVAEGDPRVFALDASRMNDLPKDGEELLETPPTASKN